MQQALFSLDTSGAEISVSQKPQSLTFTWVSPTGMSVHKKYTFSPDSYRIGLELTVNNPSQQAFQARPYLSILHPAPQKNQTYAFEGPSALIDGKLHEIPIKKIPDQNTLQGRIAWVALQDRYFMASIIPEEELEAVMRLSLVGEVSSRRAMWHLKWSWFRAPKNPSSTASSWDPKIFASCKDWVTN
jgi:YidC/Oxa1 family membrane protein insertase